MPARTVPARRRCSFDAAFINAGIADDGAFDLFFAAQKIQEDVAVAGHNHEHEDEIDAKHIVQANAKCVWAFDFIEPDKKKNYRKEKVIITPADITTVTEQITSTWQKIQERDFYTGCGKEDCHWCEFVKTNNLAVALHELEEEEELPD